MASRPAAKRRERAEGKAAVAPAARTTVTAAAEPKGPSVWTREGLSAYLKAVRLEMGRVTWPSRKELQAATAVVVLTLLVYSAYLGLLDQILKRLLP